MLYRLICYAGPMILILVGGLINLRMLDVNCKNSKNVIAQSCSISVPFS